MLTAEERQEIESELQHYAYREAAAVEALKVVQRHRGWVTDEGLQDVAELLGQTPAELDSVATFYNLVYRRPVGRHVILICDSVSCWLMGYDNLREYLAGRLGIGLGETTADGRFTLLPNACLGACDQAPVLMIDDDLYGNLDREKIDALLARYS